MPANALHLTYQFCHDLEHVASHAQLATCHDTAVTVVSPLVRHNATILLNSLVQYAGQGRGISHRGTGRTGRGSNARGQGRRGRQTGGQFVTATGVVRTSGSCTFLVLCQSHRPSPF